jgi:hypothetical protein
MIDRNRPNIAVGEASQTSQLYQLDRHPTSQLNSSGEFIQVGNSSHSPAAGFHRRPHHQLSQVGNQLQCRNHPSLPPATASLPPAGHPPKSDKQNQTLSTMTLQCGTHPNR